MTLEADIENECVALAESHGWKSMKVMSPGVKGRLDRLFIKDGKHIWIEYKNPDKNSLELDPLQEIEFNDLIDHGAKAYVHNSVAATAEVLGIPYAQEK